ncbi:hypothetical protein HDU90_002907 [Geranomyces variabilis]|nr:hypothetical protein HDU90_002907 [Geranomyces variabilis]
MESSSSLLTASQLTFPTVRMPPIIVADAADPSCRIFIYRSVEELFAPQKRVPKTPNVQREVTPALPTRRATAPATGTELPAWVFQTVGQSARMRILRTTSRGKGQVGPRSTRGEQPPPIPPLPSSPVHRGGSSDRIIVVPCGVGRAVTEYNPPPTPRRVRRGPKSRESRRGEDDKMPPLAASSARGRTTAATGVALVRPPWRLEQAKPDPAIPLRVLTDEVDATAGKDRVKTAETETSLPRIVGSAENAPSSRRQLAFVMTAQIFGRGGDIRSSVNGALIYTIQRRVAAQTTSLFLIDKAGFAVWKLTERPGEEVGNNYDLYGRGKTAACGSAGWVLRGMVDRRSSNIWAPKLELKWNGASITMLGDFHGRNFQFRATHGSQITGTFNQQSPPINPVALDEAGEAASSAFPDKWDLRIIPASLPGSPRDRSPLPHGTGVAIPMPPEMYVAAGLVVQYFLAGERAAL